MANVPAAGDVTRLLDRLSEGRSQAFDALLPVVYGELRRQAARYLRKDRLYHTLQPTALVNEAFLRAGLLIRIKKYSNRPNCGPTQYSRVRSSCHSRT